MVEYIQEYKDTGIEALLDQSRQDLSNLKKKVNISDKKENIDLNTKIPPKLKDIYRRFLKVHSKQDIKKIQFDGEELEIFVNIFQVYTYTKLGSEVIENLKTIFNAQGNIDILLKNFGGLKLAIVQMGEQELFAINHTFVDGSYSPRTANNMPIVVDLSDDKFFVRDLENKELEGRYAIMPDGNLLPIDENGNYPKGTYFFRDLSFRKGNNGDFIMNTTSSVDVMYKSLYEKKKAKIGIIPEVKSMQNMGYMFERDDRTRTVLVKKENIKSKYSEPLLSYQTDKDFLKRLDDAQKEIDEVIKKSDKQKEDFSGFYKKYFNDNGTYQGNFRYMLIREGETTFTLVDTENRKKSITLSPISLFDEKDRMLTDKDIDAIIDQYEAKQIYLKFIAKNNKQNVVNVQGKHMDNTYYVGYPFMYKGHAISLETSSLTKWKYALVIREHESDVYIGTVYLDNTMNASDIESQIDKLIK